MPSQKLLVGEHYVVVSHAPYRHTGLSPWDGDNARMSNPTVIRSEKDLDRCLKRPENTRKHGRGYLAVFDGKDVNGAPIFTAEHRLSLTLTDIEESPDAIQTDDIRRFLNGEVIQTGVVPGKF